jgi:hypothetical protein
MKDMATTGIAALVGAQVDLLDCFGKQLEFESEREPVQAAIDWIRSVSVVPQPA